MNSTNTINLSNGYEELITELQKIVDGSREFEQKNIEHHSTKLDQGLNKKTEADNRKNKRLTVLQRREAIQDKRYEAFLQAQEKTKEANDKYQARMSEWRTLEEETRKSNRLIHLSRENIAILNEEYTQENLERKAEILGFEKENLNVDVTVLVQVMDTSRTIQWQTNNIFIRDTCGKFLDYDFGKFDVTIRLVNACNSFTLIADCEQVGIDAGRHVRGANENPHPHINKDNTACLGNTVTQHLIAGMRVLDVSGVIVRVSEFLSSYNRGDAWTPLSSWVPNKADYGSCQNCNGPEGYCSCTRCYECLRYIAPEELSNCQVCYTCCMRIHKYKSQEDHGVGLYSSQCFPK